MKYKNYHPADNDWVGKLLQNSIDYNYLKHVAPDQIPTEIKWMWRFIRTIGFIILCSLITKYN